MTGERNISCALTQGSFGKWVARTLYEWLDSWKNKMGAFGCETMGNVVSKWISGNNQTFRARKRTFTAKFTHSEYNPKERYWLENQTFVQNPQIHREKTNERRMYGRVGKAPLIPGEWNRIVKQMWYSVSFRYTPFCAFCFIDTLFLQLVQVPTIVPPSSPQP